MEDNLGWPGFEGRQNCCSRNLGKFGIIEDGGSRDNHELRMGVDKTKSEKIDSNEPRRDLPNQQSLRFSNVAAKLGKSECEAGKLDFQNYPALRRKESIRKHGIASHVLQYTVSQYTVFLHGWGNMVLFCDSVVFIIIIIFVIIDIVAKCCV